jgi:serine kinase of HPr protein (carbohydrate metabolism regulator)
MIVHAGLVAQRIGGVWRGALIEGPSGAGKSDLALRGGAEGLKMVADDRALLWVSGGRLYGRAPDVLAGRIEVRGLDVLDEPATSFCEVVLLGLCATPERLPEPEFAERLGVRLPVLRLAALEASAPAKLARALRHLGCDARQAYQTPPAASFLPPRG